MKRLAHICLVFILLSGGNAIAADFLMSEKTWRKLKSVQEAVAERQYEQAIESLKAIRPAQRFKKYEQSLIYQNLAYAYQETGNTSEAIRFYRKCLSLNALPTQSLQRVRTDTMYLLMSQRDYAAVTDLYREAKADLFSLEVRMMVAYAWYQQKQTEKSLVMLEEGLRQHPERMREDWLRLLLQIYQDEKNFEKQRNVLKRLIVVSQETSSYWIYLSNLYLEHKRFRQAASVVQLALSRGILKKESELLSAVNVLYGSGLPFEAAQLVKDALKNKQISNSRKNRRVLVTLLISAKEADRAIHVLKGLVDESKLAEDILLLASLYQQEERWGEIVSLVQGYSGQEGNKLLPYEVRALTMENKFDEAYQRIDGLSEERKKRWRDYIAAEKKRRSQLLVFEESL